LKNFTLPANEIRSQGLILRSWRDEDREPFAAMNADPYVMEFFPSALSRQRSDEMLDGIRSNFVEYGFGLWAVEVPGVAPFAGFIGLAVPSFVAHFTPCVEIGWRLAREYWGRGYAVEGARMALAFGFDKLGMRRVVSFTVTANARSIRVMEKLGMQHVPADDFDHPKLPEGHPLRRHVLYRMSREGWAAQKRALDPLVGGKSPSSC
jgi:RimJ/RimL family protein N-acetyltransferase